MFDMNSVVKLTDKKLFATSAAMVSHAHSLTALNHNAKELDENLQRDSANSSTHSNYSEQIGREEKDVDAEQLIDSNLVESLSANSTSSSEESSGSADEEDSQSDEDERTPNNLYQTHHRAGSIGRKFTAHDKEDLFLHSLEVDHFAPTKFLVRNRNKKDLDNNTSNNLNRPSLYPVASTGSFSKNVQSNAGQKDISSFVQSGNNGVNNSAKVNSNIFGTRTIKAATRYIDAQGKRAASLTKQQKSLSMVDLASSPPLTPLSLNSQESPSGKKSPSSLNLACSSSSSSNALISNPAEANVPTLATIKSSLNHATGAIRSIIESQYAVLQQEANNPKHGLELKRKKRQNKFRTSFTTPSNSMIKPTDLYRTRFSEILEHPTPNEIISTHSSHESPPSDRSSALPLEAKNLSTDKSFENLNKDMTNEPMLSQFQSEDLPNSTVSAPVSSNIERKSQQFSCLPSRPSPFPTVDTQLRANEHSNPLRSISMQAPDCPLERFQFYKSFSQLVRRGRRGLHNARCTTVAFENKHNLGGFIELVYKQELRDLIWLEIKAWMINRSMIEQDYFLCQQRKKIPKTLEKVMKFVIQPHQSLVDGATERPRSVDPDSKRTECTTGTSTETGNLKTLIDQDVLAASVAIKLSINENSNDEQRNHLDNPADSPNPEDENCNCSETLSRLCQFCVDKETAAFEQVNAILNEIDDIEQLYPCVKALAIDYPMYSSDEFAARIKSLYLYQNIVRDLREKTNLLAKLFHITNREAAGWPNFHDQNSSLIDYALTTSSDCTPEIFNTQANFIDPKYGYSYKLNAPVINSSVKQVHFRSNSNPDLTYPGMNSPESICSSNPNQSTNSETGVKKMENPFFQSKPSIYRRYVDKALKHKGLRYIYHQLSHILRPLLYRVHAALKKPPSLQLDAHGAASLPQLPQADLQPAEDCVTCSARANFTESGPAKSHCNCIDKQNASTTQKEPKSPDTGRMAENYFEELSQFGVWSVAYQQMGLPTFHRPFLFLLRVTVDVVHECLILRIEQQPEQPSNVSVGQLIRECKEVIKASVQIKQHYINLAQIVLGEAGTELFEAQLDTFNDDLKTMLIIYLKYLDLYLVCMQSFTSKSNSTLKQKGYLEEEWNFVRCFSKHVPGGEALAANKFCVLASDLLTSIGDYIQNGVDDCFQQFNQALTVLNVDETQFRKGILGSCRAFKLVFQEANAKVCQAAAFAKSLRKDLEIAAEYQILTSELEFLNRLRETEHVRVIAPNCCNHLLFIPSHMQSDVGLLWQLLDMTCGGRSSVDLELFDVFSGYLLITNLTPTLESQWSGGCVYLEPTIETTLSLSYVEASGVLFLVSNPSQLPNRCRQFAQLMRGCLKVLKYQTSCNQAIADALTALKNEALKIQEKTAVSLKAIYKQLDLSALTEIDEPDEQNILQMRCLDVLHQGFKFAFEYEKALTRLITGDSRVKLAKQLINLALQWITFVRTRCEKGRGLRARWVYPGLQYLIVALEPQYIQVLNDLEFKHLKIEVDSFLTHVLGSTERSPKILLPLVSNNYQGPYPVLSADTINKPLASSLNFQRSQSVVNVKGMFGDLNFFDKQPFDQNEQKGTRLEDWISRKLHASSNLPIILQRRKPLHGKVQQKVDQLEHRTSIATQGDLISEETKKLEDLEASSQQQQQFSFNSLRPRNSPGGQPKLANAGNSLKALDECRDQVLKERGLIGSVSDLVIQRASLQIAARKVNFPWQRGFKIGEGRFGKVYTAVNNSTGELIAMKEIHLQQANDSRAIKETIDEIRIFEGIKHPNLVKYFGVEIHRDELYIFMEYCNEGSLENAVQLNLPEQLVRKYTRQLLEAVNCLHENGIVHRDIKSANIFLTSDGNLKLGDFGCCMKLKNHSTMPGELCTLVGTPAYMAPEMFTRNSIDGHGRSSDIWSIGCVVLEMLTGRRPWHDLDNSYQIMFKVGMGECPEVPDEIESTEGKNFIAHCLRQDARLRWSASQLLSHSFTKVLEDDYI